MTPFVRIAVLHGVAATMLIVSRPAQAEGNRLLPFWGQPYPYGYSARSAAPSQEFLRRCPIGRHGVGRDFARGRDGRCDVVLHARD